MRLLYYTSGFYNTVRYTVKMKYKKRFDEHQSLLHWSQTIRTFKRTVLIALYRIIIDASTFGAIKMQLMKLKQLFIIDFNKVCSVSGG